MDFISCFCYKDHVRGRAPTYSPICELESIQIHYRNELPYAFTNWAFLNKDAEKRFMTTAELNPEDYNSGNIPWHIDTICVDDVKSVMKWTKQYFTNLLGYNKPVKWLRITDDEVITRVVTRYTKEHYGVN